MKWLVPINSTGNVSYCYWYELGPKTWSVLAIFDYILIGPLLSFVIFSGIFGNFFCILIFSRFFSKLKLYRHLLALALWDMFYIITSFFLYNLPTLMYNDILPSGPYVVTTPVLYYISTVARTSSIWTVLVIAFDRYLAICHPFRFIEVDSERRFTFLIVAIGICSFLYGLPRYFEVKIQYCHEVTTRLMVPHLSKTTMRTIFVYWLLYRVIGGLLFYSLIPFATLLFLTIRMSMEIKRMGQFVPVLDRCNYTDTNENTTISTSTNSSLPCDKINHWMHLAMISKFLICHSFPAVLDVWELAQPSLATDLKWYKSYTFMSHSVMLLASLNSSCNFFIYYLTSLRFRKDFHACVVQSK